MKSPAARWSLRRGVQPDEDREQFRDLVEKVIQRDGCEHTLWLETSVDDPGRAMTRQAVSEHVDLVVGAGVDGTVRIVADGLAGTGIPMGLVPAGTANLLARNLCLLYTSPSPRDRS